MICFENHKEGHEILLEYSTGTLDAARTHEVDQHVESCVECRRLVEAQRTVFSALDQWTAPEVSADFDKKLYARIAADKPSLWQRWFPVAPVAWWKPAVPVGLAALALSALFVVRTSHPVPVPNQPGIEKTDIEHVEQALDDFDLLVPTTTSSPSVM